MKKKINNLNFFFLFSCSIILLVVYYLEYFLDLKPCILCIYQRIPYFFAIFIIFLESELTIILLINLDRLAILIE